MPEFCPECGATTPEGGSCRDHFHALLLLESQIPGGLPHFYAVATYGLQHPDSMNYTADALSGLHSGLADMLDGRTTIDAMRRHTRRAVNGAVRITRRAGDLAVDWPRGHWPITVANVLAVEPNAVAYAECVTGWARSVREALDRSRT